MPPALCPPLSSSNATNVLQLTNNMLATNSGNICQVWATTPIPTTPRVAASVMLVAPQYVGYFPWFLVKSPIINFSRSLQPAPTERTFPLTWNDQYMVYCHDQVDMDCHHHVNAEMLLDAFIKFRIPAQIPLGIRKEVGEHVQSSPEWHEDVNATVGASSEEAPSAHSLNISPLTPGNSRTATYVNRGNSLICPPTLVPVQEGLFPTSLNAQPIVDLLWTLSTTGDECHDRKNVVSHKKRKHDVE
ncbi:hypothetical protein PISMIDRAFT_24074 [Pisolithus microcarpus 441]|uniref:Uncharacterized protein n=1 Tax=Pisolithus microcarpus 441 TaxID=765257 RepID=A0A0C9ZM98_9AGAM|nr:hypothetical protein PISMIDRAFT_24074 [Pisolithus microcarpus 441]